MEGMARSRKSRGAAMMELALFSPWIIFLFVGTLDWGFYAYSLITLETATRNAASWNANNNDPNNTYIACQIVTSEMQTLVNMRGVTTCGGSSAVSITATQVTGPDSENAAQVAVTYTTPQMIPIPGLLAKQFTITRVVTMKL
jgi:Flp pilus assembly protein TadG